jgi:hypothetical protein
MRYPSSETSSRLAGQEIPRFCGIRSSSAVVTRTHHCFHRQSVKFSPYFHNYFLNTRFNIILPSMRMCPKWHAFLIFRIQLVKSVG